MDPLFSTSGLNWESKIVFVTLFLEGFQNLSSPLNPSCLRRKFHDPVVQTHDGGWYSLTAWPQGSYLHKREQLWSVPITSNMTLLAVCTRLRVCRYGKLKTNSSGKVENPKRKLKCLARSARYKWCTTSTYTHTQPHSLVLRFAFPAPFEWIDSAPWCSFPSRGWTCGLPIGGMCARSSRWWRCGAVMLLVWCISSTTTTTSPSLGCEAVCLSGLVRPSSMEMGSPLAISAMQQRWRECLCTSFLLGQGSGKNLVHRLFTLNEKCNSLPVNILRFTHIHLVGRWS